MVTRYLFAVDGRCSDCTRLTSYASLAICVRSQVVLAVMSGRACDKLDLDLKEVGDFKCQFWSASSRLICGGVSDLSPRDVM